MRASKELTSEKVAGVWVPVFPLDAYQVDSDQQVVIDRALYVVAEECMQRKGLHWPSPLEELGESRSPNERRYGVIDMPLARKYGYKLPLPPGVTKAQAVEYMRKESARNLLMTDEVTVAYTGEEISSEKPEAGSVGCRGEARTKLGLPEINSPQGDPVAGAALKAWEETRRDRRSVDADALWSKCMKRSGYSYSDPHVAAGDKKWAPVAGGGDFPSPSEGEVEAALADVSCKQETNYVEKMQRVETSYQDLLISETLDTFSDYRAGWQQSLEKAEKVLR